MRRRKLLETKKPVALACALLEDEGRYLFLETKDFAGKSLFGLPSMFVFAGEDPVEALKRAVAAQCGIDAQVHQAIVQGEFNVGSRKRRKFVPALGFMVSAKRQTAKVDAPFCGFKWMGVKESLDAKLERKSEWLRRAERT